MAIPASVADIKALIALAERQGTTLLPRAGGTSLAGQVVGNGIVVDVGTHFKQILELNSQEKWVRVQPGVIRNDLNAYLKPHGLLFGPETSTASRAMIGGMIGNNSCGLHSIIWGATRHSLLEVEALLADGSEVLFKALNKAEFEAKCTQDDMEGSIYRDMQHIIANPELQQHIHEGFPRPEITRRNTGYALDALLAEWQQLQAGGTFNMCPIIAGSEGTLCFITAAKLRLIPLPPPHIVLLNVHCSSFSEATRANLIALKHQPAASEFLDELSIILTEGTTELSQYRDWVQGQPKAVLMVEFFDHSHEGVAAKAAALEADLQQAGLGYAYVKLYNEATHKAWELRKSSLSILGNQSGDLIPANLIEDCAVTPEDLPDYIAEIEALLQKYQLTYSIAAHAGAGELHVCPMMNVRTQAGKDLFRKILEETVPIIKKYRGSLSGEHGDGRLRGEFIAEVMGPEVYRLFERVKHIWDPAGLFNKGKITDTPPMHESMRIHREQEPPPLATQLSFEANGGILKLAEKCSGSGDCRKTEITGGTMCPSFMATRLEHDSTRARANMLRHYYSPEQDSHSLQEPTKQVLDLCLSCKGCKAECPSSVDVGKMKAEFTQKYYERHGAPLRSRLVGSFSKLMALASIFPAAYNFVFRKPALRSLANRLVGFHPQRSMPHLAGTTLRAWYHSRLAKGQAATTGKKIYLFCDEFTNYNDVEIGKKAIMLLEKLGYRVLIPQHAESGRSYLSKGFLKKAKQIAHQNISQLQGLISADSPLIGIEPSAILGFRDEYPDLADAQHKQAALSLAKNCLLFEEFIAAELDKGAIDRSLFSKEQRLIKLHGHCHQKALSNMVSAKKTLSIPTNYQVQLIPSGCCGMAGSFGYEAEHFELSRQIGELVLFPTVRAQGEQVIIAAAGTSCRHQILDGTGRLARHPIEILWEALV